MPRRKGFRIQIRLYKDLPDDALVLEWIETLPKSGSGRPLIKQALVREIASQMRAGKKNRQKKNGKEARTVMSPGGGNGDEARDVSNASTPVAGELPEFPDVAKLEF